MYHTMAFAICHKVREHISKLPKCENPSSAKGSVGALVNWHFRNNSSLLESPTRQTSLEPSVVFSVRYQVFIFTKQYKRTEASNSE